MLPLHGVQGGKRGTFGPLHDLHIDKRGEKEMKEIIRIHKLSQERLDNALHLDFHGTVCERLREAGLKKIGLSEELVEEYEKCIQDEVEMIKETRARPETEGIAQKEKECNHWLSYIAAVVRAMLLSPEPDEVEAAKALYRLWRADKPLQGVALGRKSAGITALLMDLKGDRYAPFVTRLRLDRGVQLLDEANSALFGLQLQRSNARSKSSRPSSTEIRPTTDDVYRRIVWQLEMAYTIGKPPIDHQVVANLVNLINIQVNQTRTTYKQSLSQRRAHRRQKEAREEGQA